MRCRKVLPVVAASVLLVLVLTSSAMAAEKTVKQWWDGEYGTTYPYDTYAGADVADPNTWPTHAGYWSNHIQGQFWMRLEEAGYAKYNVLGWIEVDANGYLKSGGSSGVIFTGDDTAGKQVYLDIQVDWFALYLKNQDGKTYYTVNSPNPNGYQAAWIFDDPQPMHPYYYPHVIAWEDQAPAHYSGTDHDHNDMIVRMSATPEPATFVLLALSALPFAYLRRRKKT